MKTTLRDIAIEEIAESPHNPRRVCDEALLEELADSIREQGVLEPLLVRPRAQAAARAKATEQKKATKRARAAREVRDGA